VFRQAFGYLVIEPRFVAKLDSMSRGFPMPQRLQKFLQSLDILFEKCRELPHHSSQSLAEWRCGVATTDHRFFDVDQLFVVGDVTMPFDGKRKFVWRFVPPFFKRALWLESIKRAVHFDRGKTLCTESEPLFLRPIVIETGAPAFVIPAAGSDVCFARHASKDFERGVGRTLVWRKGAVTVASAVLSGTEARKEQMR
jgi:hypothetical protein